jgi:BirA family transcriptional regulator, biotin operon repressor / biotin---[acetyl-CoA-carboxylase] ligase
VRVPLYQFMQDRKAGGILVESIVRAEGAPSGSSGSVPHDSSIDGGGRFADWKWAIAGIGININQTSFPANLPNPVSLKQITGKEHDPLLLAKELCTIIDRNFRDLIKNGFEKLLHKYNEHLYKKDSIVKLKKGNRVFEAKIIKVIANGKLVIHHAIEEEIDFGDIEWVI